MFGLSSDVYNSNVLVMTGVDAIPLISALNLPRLECMANVHAREGDDWEPRLNGLQIRLVAERASMAVMESTKLK